MECFCEYFVEIEQDHTLLQSKNDAEISKVSCIEIVSSWLTLRKIPMDLIFFFRVVRSVAGAPCKEKIEM